MEARTFLGEYLLLERDYYRAKEGMTQGLLHLGLSSRKLGEKVQVTMGNGEFGIMDGLVDRERVIKAMEAELSHIRRVVGALSDPLQVRLLQEFYFQGMRMKEIADLWRETPHQVYRIHSRALGEVQKILNIEAALDGGDILPA